MSKPYLLGAVKALKMIEDLPFLQGEETMPRNGYWIECVPIQEQGNKNPLSFSSDQLYSATTESFPEITELAPSPDQAIEKLRDRLKNIKADYQKTGKLLPERDNPVRPPHRLRSVMGWISVYVEFPDKAS